MQPATQGKVDPSVLAALPPSMQLDLLGQVMVVLLLMEEVSSYYSLKRETNKLCMLNFLSLFDQLITCLPDEGEIDGREQTKVSEGQEGISLSFLAHQYIMISLSAIVFMFFRACIFLRYVPFVV